MKKKNYKQRIVIDLLIFGLLGSIVYDLITSRIDEEIKKIEKIWSPFPHAYMIFLLFAFFLLVLYRINYEKIFLDVDKKISFEEEENERQNLLLGLSKRYVARTKKKMQDELSLTIHLQLKYIAEAAKKENIKDYLSKDYEEKSIDNFETLYSEYAQNQRRLLIVGEPGSGKTLLLLKFANKLLATAISNPGSPIPLILNLATWRKTFESFESWLEQNIVNSAGEFGTSQEHAKKLANGDSLILLLDGLDEVPEEDRDSCMANISQYMKRIENGRDDSRDYPVAIICCRTHEFLKLKATILVSAAVSIEPITELYVLQELHRIRDRQKNLGFGADKLLNDLGKNPQLLKLLTTAFYLHIAFHLNERKYNLDKVQSTTALLSIYVKSQISLIKEHSAKRSIKTLSFLAEKISSSEKRVTFELIDVQPNWIGKVWVYSVVSFLPMIIILSFTTNFKTLILYLMFCASLYLLPGSEQISSSDQYQFDFKNLKLKDVSIVAVLAPIYAVIVTLFWAYVMPFGRENPHILASFLAFTCALGIPPLLTTMQVPKRLPSGKFPYSRFFKSSKMKMISILCRDLSVLLGLYYSTTLPIWALLLGFLPTTGTFFKHLLVRFLLWIRGDIPIRLVRFLNTVSLTGLMEKDGGQWRFRHQLIQDYFARQKGS